MAHVLLKNLHKSFGSTHVVKGIDLEITDGEFVVFVGPSGCGKSTLLRMISGLEEADKGDIFLDKERVNDHTPIERGIAMVFQSYALYPHMTVAENIGFPLKMVDEQPEKIKEKVQYTADILQIGDLLDRKPDQLSGGQKQRVAMGRTIVRDPVLFLFDEPLSNLDADLRVEMRVELEKLHKRLGSTMIYVTHDQVEAMTLADRIVVLKDGGIEQIGAPIDLYQNPANTFVANFLGAPKINFLSVGLKEVTKESSKFILTDGTQFDIPMKLLNVKLDDTLQLGIRPEDLKIYKGEQTQTNDDFIIPFELEIHERLGPTSYLYGTCCGQRLVVEHKQRGVVTSEDCQSIIVTANHAHLFDQEGLSVSST